MKKENKTMVFNKGYVAGYNQCRVENKQITQKQADWILEKWDKTSLKEKKLLKP